MWGQQIESVIRELVMGLKSDPAPHTQVGAFLLAHGYFTEGTISPHPVSIGDGGVITFHPRPFRSFFRRTGDSPSDLGKRLEKFVADSLRRLVVVESNTRCDRGDNHPIASYRFQRVLIVRLPLEHLFISDADLEMYTMSFSPSCISALDALDRRDRARTTFRELRGFRCIPG